MLLFQLVYRLEVAIKIRARIGPRITWVVNVLIRPKVGEEDLSGISTDVRKCVKYVTAYDRRMMRLIFVVTRAMRV